MKLITEDDFDEECMDGTIELKILVDKKQKAQILKWQEDSEKWKTKKILNEDMMKQNFLYGEIVERLKKRIEEIKEFESKPNQQDLMTSLLPELQKILGEEK